MTNRLTKLKRLTEKQRNTKKLLEAAKNVGKPTVKPTVKPKGKPTVKPKGKPKGKPTVSTATKFLRGGGKALFGRFALAGTALALGGEYLYDKYQEHIGGYKPKVAPGSSPRKKNVRKPGEKLIVEPKIKPSGKSLRIPENNVKRPYSEGAKKGLQKTVKHASSLRLPGQNDPKLVAEKKVIKNKFPANLASRNLLSSKTNNIYSHFGANVVKATGEGQDGRLIKRTEKDQPTTAAIEKHANEFSSVTTAKVAKAEPPLNKKFPKSIRKPPLPQKSSYLNQAEKFKVEHSRPIISGNSPKLEVIRKDKPILVKAKPTAFDQAAANFLGVSFKTHRMKESKDPSNYGQMVPDTTAGVTADPTGEGFDLFGGGAKRRREEAKRTRKRVGK